MIIVYITIIIITKYVGFIQFAKIKTNFGCKHAHFVLVEFDM